MTTVSPRFGGLLRVPATYLVVLHVDWRGGAGAEGRSWSVLAHTSRNLANRQWSSSTTALLRTSAWSDGQICQELCMPKLPFLRKSFRGGWEPHIAMVSRVLQDWFLVYQHRIYKGAFPLFPSLTKLPAPQFMQRVGSHSISSHMNCTFARPGSILLLQ